MFQSKNIYQNLPGIMLILLAWNSDAQFASKVIDFTPAPGQYTNADFLGTPSAANSIVGTNKGMVSLGAFGGSITVYFEHGIHNDPANPYGVDFTVYGNATPTWSEPGIIQVMKDENGNGIPDETWYEIAGSDHFWNTTNLSYEVTYQNSGLNFASNIQWTDNQGKSGFIPVNSFHQQPYYPKPDLFPEVSTDHYTLKGTRIAGQIDLSNPGVVNSYHRAFGYADNTPVLSYTEKLPDNPYTPEIEGSGGDAIDIGWAVDKDRKPVHLDEIHFIRIYTGMNALAGWLGEISTEVTGIRDVEPATVTGVHSMVVIQDLPTKIRLGESLNLNAIAFESGIRQENTPIIWTVDQQELAGIENSWIIAKKDGIIRLRATSGANSEVFAEKEIEIFSAAKATITVPSTSLKINDKMDLSGKLTDQNGNAISGISISWRIDNENIANITTLDGKYFLNGKQTGKSWLVLEIPDIPSLRDSVLIEVLPESVRKKVFISVKTSEKTLLPLHSVWVDQVDLTPWVDRHQKFYGLQDIKFVSLAHAIAAAFKNTDLENEWAFRDDAEGGSVLYLWKVPEIEEGSTSFDFGYGGSRTSDAYRKTWMVLLNQQPILSGFDQVKVNNNDEILVYHVIDNALPWQVTQLAMKNDTVKTNELIEIQLRKYFCSMGDNRNVSVNSSEVIANQAVKLMSKNQENNPVSFMTDEFGKVLISEENAGDYMVTSGIDAANLAVESATGIKALANNPLICKVFPNPFSEKFRIQCVFPITSIEIHDPQGKLVFHQTGLSPEVNLTTISSGVYILSIHSGTQVFRQKMIKN